MYEEWPSMDIDHKNEIKDDNRFENLRLATESQNAAHRSKKNKNNKSGYKGVHWCGNKCRAEIMKDGKLYHIGYFITAEEAHEAYKNKARDLFGEFAI